MSCFSIQIALSQKVANQCLRHEFSLQFSLEGSLQRCMYERQHSPRTTKAFRVIFFPHKKYCSFIIIHNKNLPVLPIVETVIKNKLLLYKYLLKNSISLWGFPPETHYKVLQHTKYGRESTSKLKSVRLCELPPLYLYVGQFQTKIPPLSIHKRRNFILSQNCYFRKKFIQGTS